MRSGHVKPTSHPVAKVTRRTDTGSLDSDDPSSTSDDESSPRSEHGHRRRSRRPISQGRTNTTTTDNLPVYYDEDDWSTGEHEAESRTPRQKQPAHIGKERKPTHVPVVEGKLHIGRGGIGYSDKTSSRQQQVRATQKHASEKNVKGVGAATAGTTKVSEVKVATSRSGDSSKLGSRQSGTNPPAKRGPDTRTSPAAKQSQQQQEQSARQSKVAMQVPAPAVTVQQQSPIQGLIDGPNSERDGRESPPYLERQIPRDPSSQPQDAWPLFEEDPANIHTATTCTSLPPPMAVAAMMQSVATPRQQQHQTASPPPPSPPTGSVLPTASTSTTTTHTDSPTLLEPRTGIIPRMLPHLADRVHPHVPSLVPTPPQSPVPDQFQGGVGVGVGAGAGRQPIPLSAMFPPPTCSSPSTVAPQPVPPMFHSLMQRQGHFIPPMSTAAAMQQFFSIAGGIPPIRPHTGMFHNQTHSHSNMGPPPSELASSKTIGGGGGEGVGGGDASATMGMPPLISPLQPLSTKRSSPPHGERTVAAAMSPLTVTAYTQTPKPKLTHTLMQTDVKEFREQGSQIRPRVKKTEVQTDGRFVSVTELNPPKLKNDSKGMKIKK